MQKNKKYVGWELDSFDDASNFRKYQISTDISIIVDTITKFKFTDKGISTGRYYL